MVGCRFPGGSHMTLPRDRDIETYPAHRGNQITKEYYDILVGPINNGEVHKAVMAVTCPCHNKTAYYLISEQ